VTPQSDEDEVWRQLVASFNESAEDTSADQPWPDRENVPQDAAPEPPQGDDDEEDATADRPPPGPEEDHYVPPPPPPLPKMDAITKIAWLALFGGPAYLVFAALMDWPMQGWIVFGAVAAFIGGFVALVVRMGDGPPPDSGWDDGAVI
jgi:hypothetical protein